MIERLVVGELEANCYLFYDENLKQGLVIDPGAESEKIIKKIKYLGLKIEYIINTHGHSDHIGANKELRKYTRAKLLIHKEDLPYLFYFSSPEPDSYLEENQIFWIGSYQLKVIHTPGHTPGSVCLLGDNLVFTGDTLFCGGIGRTDLHGGDERGISSSLKNKLLTLPDKTAILPGHGCECSIGEEKKHNFFLQSLNTYNSKF